MTVPLLTVKDVQSRLRVGHNIAYGLVASGQIRAIRVGRAIRVSEDALEDYISRSESGRADGGEHLLPQPSRRAGGASARAQTAG